MSIPEKIYTILVAAEFDFMQGPTTGIASVLRILTALSDMKLLVVEVTDIPELPADGMTAPSHSAAATAIVDAMALIGVQANTPIQSSSPVYSEVRRLVMEALGKEESRTKYWMAQHQYMVQRVGGMEKEFAPLNAEIRDLRRELGMSEVHLKHTQTLLTACETALEGRDARLMEINRFLEGLREGNARAEQALRESEARMAESDAKFKAGMAEIDRRQEENQRAYNEAMGINPSATETISMKQALYLLAFKPKHEMLRNLAGVAEYQGAAYRYMVRLGYTETEALELVEKMEPLTSLQHVGSTQRFKEIPVETHLERINHNLSVAKSMQETVDSIMVGITKVYYGQE